MTWYVDEEVRRQGLLLLGELLEQYQYSLHCLFSIDSEKIFNAMNIPIIDYTRMVAIVNEQHCSDLFSIDKNDIIGSLKKSENTLARIKNEKYSDIHHIDYFNDTIDYSYLEKNYSAFIQRNKEYLNWRYFKIPNHNYKAIKIQENYIYRNL